MKISCYFCLVICGYVPVSVYNRPEELGELYRKYAEKYAGVVRHVIDSEVRNQAVHLPLIQYRRDRAYVQQYLHRHLAERLQGKPTRLPPPLSSSLGFCRSRI